MNNVKIIRERLGLSQQAFADGIGSTQGNVSHYECQRQDPPPDVSRDIIAFAKTEGIVVTFNDIYSPLTEEKAA